MLIKIAMGLPHKPKTARQIEEAIELYRRATEFCPSQAGALRARARVRVGRGQ